MSRIYLFFAIVILMSDVTSSEGRDYVAVPGISEAEAQRFIAQALSIVETIRSAWRETVTFPQLATSFLLAANTFPDRVAFERYAAGSKYWDPQKTIYEIQWAPRVPNDERDGTTSNRISYSRLIFLACELYRRCSQASPAHRSHSPLFPPHSRLRVVGHE